MLHYIKIGNGPKTMIAFHGFGRDANMFKGYEKAYPEYTIYSISLYYHGSEWSDQNQGLRKELWCKTFSSFLAAHAIEHFSLLGYSIGGKMALYTFELFYLRVESMVLIAPYGIKANAWEYICQKSPLLFRQLEKVIDQPAFFFKLIKLLQKYKLINATLLNITKKQLDSQQVRYRAYHSIRLYGSLRLNLEKIIKYIRVSGIPLGIYLGKQDKVLPLEALHQNFTKNLPNYSLHMLSCGHAMLPEKVMMAMAEKHAPLLYDEALYGMLN